MQTHFIPLVPFHHPEVVRKTQQKWSAADDAILRKSYASKTWPELVALLGRSAPRIKNRANKLKLRRHPDTQDPLDASKEADEYGAITTGLSDKLLAVVDKLRLKKLADMDENEAQAALAFLDTNQAKLDHVDGAKRLYERLSRYFTLA